MNCSYCGNYVANGTGIGTGKGDVYCGQKCYRESGAKKTTENQYKLIIMLGMITVLCAILISPGVLITMYLASLIGTAINVQQMWIFSSLAAIVLFSLICLLSRGFKRGIIVYSGLCIIISGIVVIMAQSFNSDLLTRILQSLGVNI